MKRTGSNIRREGGQAVVELALVFPFLAVIIVAIVQFGGLYNHYETITDASRAGARKAAVSRSLADPVAAAKAAVYASAPALDAAKLVVTVTPAPPWTLGQQVEVKATYPYSINLAGVSVTSGTLTSSTKERVE